MFLNKIVQKCILFLVLLLPYTAGAQVISVNNKFYVAEGNYQPIIYNPGRIYVVNPPKITNYNSSLQENINYLIYYPVGAEQYYKPYIDMYKEALEKYKKILGYYEKIENKVNKPIYPLYFD